MTRRYVSAIILAALLLSWGLRFEIVKTDSYPWVLDSWTGQSYMADTLIMQKSGDGVAVMKAARYNSNLVSVGAGLLAVALFFMAAIPGAKPKREESE